MFAKSKEIVWVEYQGGY